MGYKRLASAEDGVLGCGDRNSGEHDGQKKDVGLDCGFDSRNDASKPAGVMVSAFLGAEDGEWISNRHRKRHFLRRLTIAHRPSILWRSFLQSSTSFAAPIFP